MAKWKRHNFLLPLLRLALVHSTSLCLPASSLVPRAAGGDKTPPDGTASPQRQENPRLHWLSFQIPRRGQLTPAVKTAHGSPSKQDDSSDNQVTSTHHLQQAARLGSPVLLQLATVLCHCGQMSSPGTGEEESTNLQHRPPREHPKRAPTDLVGSEQGLRHHHLWVPGWAKTCPPPREGDPASRAGFARCQMNSVHQAPSSTHSPICRGSGCRNLLRSEGSRLKGNQTNPS